jgi:hypothetical protein
MSDEGHANDAPRRPALLAAIVAFTLTAFAFLPALSNRLIQWDDKANLIENQRWHPLSWDSVKWAFTTFHMGPYT